MTLDFWYCRVCSTVWITSFISWNEMGFVLHSAVKPWFITIHVINWELAGGGGLMAELTRQHCRAPEVYGPTYLSIYVRVILCDLCKQGFHVVGIWGIKHWKSWLLVTISYKCYVDKIFVWDLKKKENKRQQIVTSLKKKIFLFCPSRLL